MSLSSLSLRCTERLVPATPANIAAFAPRARLLDRERDDVLTWLAPDRPVAGTGGLVARPRLGSESTPL
ncbi:MAG: hypothetical protein KDA24_25845, partial [Deltaproteobacteria bacterium]|nr:hypothetical protein [Deltaproteobacteria bacterium]